jgi:hypothetical protein
MSAATAQSRVEEVAASLVAARSSTELEPAQAVAASTDRPITNGEIDLIYRLADGLAQSGMFKDAQQATQAFAKLIFGRDLGLSATQAMTDIHIVEGKPEMSANLQAAKVRSSDIYGYRVVDLTNERCEIVFSRYGEDLVPSSMFTIEDAKRAGLVKEKSAWVKYPRNMLFARAMSNGVAWHCPDVTNGIRVYAEGEVQQAITTVSTRASSAPEPVDAQVVEDKPSDLITPEELASVKQALDAAEVDEQTETMLLGSVGVESLEELTPATLAELQEAVAKHVTGGAS